MQKIRIVNTEDDEHALSYWAQKRPEERLSAVELLREHFYIIRGHRTLPRITRVLKLVDR